MIRKNLSIDEALVVLNRAVKADPEAMEALIENHVPCNQALADDPEIQVRATAGMHSVGMLGILNGLFGIEDKGERAGWGIIAAEFEVKCSQCGEIFADKTIHDLCPTCGKPLDLGRLVGFSRTWILNKNKEK